MIIEKLQWRSVDALTQPRSTALTPKNHPKAEDDDYHDDKRLDIIDLSGLSLDAIPHPTINLAAICKLDLSNNNLQNIPEFVTARLLNVVALDVRSNQLTSLPNSIGCLSKLKLLNVSSNLLRCLPKAIQNCRNLEELNANFNKLIALPETIGLKLLKLKKLSVNSNQIMFLPYSTCHLIALRTLDVRLNCLRLLPEDLENLMNLQVLNVSQNFCYLKKLPYSIGLLGSLVELDISYNKITALPSSIGCLRRLRKLHVEGNPLICPPMDVVEMGLHTIQMYLTEKVNANGAQQDLPNHNNNYKIKKSWFRHLKKHKHNNRPRNGHTASNNSSSILSYRRGEVDASPMHPAGVLSPQRLIFSSQPNPFPRFS